MTNLLRDIPHINFKKLLTVYMIFSGVSFVTGTLNQLSCA